MPTEQDHIDILWHADAFGRADHRAARVLADAGLGECTPAGFLFRPDRDLMESLTAAQHRLHEAGLCSEWQGEAIDVLPDWDAPPLARCDKSLALPLGLRLDKICLHGLTGGAGGVPEHVWLARRARDTGFAPLHLDAMVVGGRMAGDSLARTMVHEAEEEAGLAPHAVEGLAVIERIEVRLISPRGLRFERYHVCELLLDEDFTPVCQDGEIEAFGRFAIADLPALLDGGDRFKPGIEPVLRSALERWRPSAPAVT